MTPTIYLSHGASGDWFIVEPRDAPEGQIERLLRGGRTVYKLRVRTWQGKSWARKRRLRRIKNEIQI